MTNQSNNKCCEKCDNPVPSVPPLAPSICNNWRCPCHKPEQEDYSHYHCWDQNKETPACGIPKDKHKRCCLCEKVKPEPNIHDMMGKLDKPEEKEIELEDGSYLIESKPDWEVEFHKICEFTDGGVYVSYDKTFSFIQKLLAQAKQDTLAQVKELVEKMKKGTPMYNSTGSDRQEIPGVMFIEEKEVIYNKALSDMLSELEKI